MKIKVSDVLRHVLLAFLAVVWLVPIVWLLATSFSKYTGMNSSTFFPEEWTVPPRAESSRWFPRGKHPASSTTRRQNSTP